MLTDSRLYSPLLRFTAFTTAGTAFGTVIAMPASTYLCELLGWESVFYVFGCLGLVWFLVWCLVIHDGPDVHPRSGSHKTKYIRLRLRKMRERKLKLERPEINLRHT